MEAHNSISRVLTAKAIPWAAKTKSEMHKLLLAATSVVYGAMVSLGKYPVGKNK